MRNTLAVLSILAISCWGRGWQERPRRRRGLRRGVPRSRWRAHRGDRRGGRAVGRRARRRCPARGARDELGQVCGAAHRLSKGSREGAVHRKGGAQAHEQRIRDPAAERVAGRDAGDLSRHAHHGRGFSLQAAVRVQGDHRRDDLGARAQRRWSLGPGLRRRCLRGQHRVVHGLRGRRRDRQDALVVVARRPARERPDDRRRRRVCVVSPDRAGTPPRTKRRPGRVLRAPPTCSAPSI